jgi:hypothetical protein
MITPSQTQSSSWQDYRLRRRWFFGILLTYVPGLAALGYPLSRVLDSDTPVYVLAGAWMIAFIVSSNRMDSFPCPKCQRAFFRKFLFHNPLARRCMHCEFPKWGDPESMSNPPNLRSTR